MDPTQRETASRSAGTVADDPPRQTRKRERLHGVSAAANGDDWHAGLGLEWLPMPAYSTDAEGRVQSCNKAALELWGRAPEAEEDRWAGPLRLFHPAGEPMPSGDSPTARVLRSMRPIEGEELAVERVDGSRLVVLAYATPLFDDTDSLCGAVTLLVDVSERKSTELALRRREAELTDIVEGATVGLHRLDSDGTILWANRAAMELLGTTPDEYIGHRLQEFLVEPSSVREFSDSLAKLEELDNYETKLRSNDGFIKHVQIYTSVQYVDGQVAHMRCSMRDITAQDLLARRLASSAQISQILSDAKSLDEAAPAVLQTLGEFFDADIVELWLGEERLRCVTFHSGLTGPAVEAFKNAAMQLALAPGEGLPGQVWQNQEPIWLEETDFASDFKRRQEAAGLELRELIGIPILIGGACLGVITCYIRHLVVSDPALLNTLASIGHKIGQFIQRTLREEENRYLATVVKASADAIISTSLDDVITSWNDGAERLFGYSAAEVIGKPVSIIIPEDRFFERDRLISELKGGKIVEPFETLRRNKAGDLIPVSNSFSGVRGPNGELVGTAAIIRDISDRKAAETQLVARIRQLQAVSELGLLTLATGDLQQLFDQAAIQLAKGLDVELTQILELLPDGQRLMLRAGAGWDDGLVGYATVAAHANSQAAYTLSVNHPVIVESLKSETRFTGSRLLTTHDVESGLSVIILGKEEQPFGVLGAYSRSYRQFTGHDVHFLQSMANVLASAIERKKHEDRQAVLINELSHRVKNILSVIQAIGRQTGINSSGIEDFTRRFEGRIQALSKAHDLLTASQWDGASLRELVRIVVGIYPEGKRVEIDIEDVNLSPTSTQALVLVFHELMTNAIKYGALSNDGGRIFLEGRCEEKDEELYYFLSWRERGGPPVEPTSHQGFGSRLITSTIERQCNGTLWTDWEPGGMTLGCKLLLSSISPRPREQDVA